MTPDDFLDHFKKVMDFLQAQVRGMISARQAAFNKDRATALKYILTNWATNERDREVLEILAKQPRSARGNRSGNRSNPTIWLKDMRLLQGYAHWRTSRNGSASDRQFAVWWCEHDQKKTVTEIAIRRISQQLRDARRREKHREASAKQLRDA